MALTRLDNLISSKTGKYLYVSPDDFNATDEINNRGNSPIRPFRSIQRAFLEISRFSYQPGPDNDRFDQFTVMVMPGKHYVDNRPGLATAEGIDEFAFDQALNQWIDNSNLDIGDPNNCLYKFNNTEGGAIIPRGSSIIGYDLRRTSVHPLFVPDPADRLESRSAIFNVTGGCYFWQFTIRDGDLEPASPLYDNTDGIGKVYYQNGDWTAKAVPNFSHHKLTVFEYADKEELGLYYQKVAKAFSQYQPTIDDPGEFGDRIQETRIVGPLSDIRSVETIKLTDSSPAGTINVEVTSKVNHGYFKNQFVAIENNGLDEQLNGVFTISEIDLVDQRKFSYNIPGTVAALGTSASLISGTTYTTSNGLDSNAVVKAEVDSVESASPYVFNCSIRSTWGICGIWANGLKATGFKSMVIAQYTGVSLQKDDRAFIRYDEFTNTFNQASLADAFATVPYHTKGDAYWKDDWRNFHVRASDDAFIQCVSIFAVGFADHFLMESGGDMSITNSNSNFGNTSLHAIGHKGFAFTQDKGGYITDIVPPQVVDTTTGNIKKNAYYTIDIPATKNLNSASDQTKIYLGDDEAFNPETRVAASIDGFRIGARSDEKLYVKLIPRSAGSSNIFQSTLSPNGFKKFNATATILNPTGITINNKDLDAADLIEANKEFIAYEAYGYITNKYPYLLDREGIDIVKCRRDIGYLLDATIQDLRLGGNINTIQAGESYYVGNNLSYITSELTETLEGYDYARDLAIASIRNFTYLRTGAETTAGTAIVDVGDTSGLVQGMTVADYDPTQFTDNKLNAGATRPASPVIPDNTYVKSVISSTEIELGQKATFSSKKVISDRNGDARNLLLSNKLFIAAEAFDRMVLDFPSYTSPTGYGPQDCRDDLVDIVEAIAENTAYGGNDEVWDAAYHYDSGAVQYISQKKEETIRAIEYARDMSVQIMRNEKSFIFGSHGLTQTYDNTVTYEPPEVVNDRNGDARNLILANKNLIAAESVERMLVRSSTAEYTPTDAEYDPATGDLTLDIQSHGLTAASAITASDASYNPETGWLTITSNGHGLAAGSKVKIEDESLTLTCSMDGDASTHVYPRSSDPISNKWVEVAEADTNTFSIDVGKSLLIGHDVTAAAYVPATGLLTATIPGHQLSEGQNVRIEDGAFTFTCAQDNYGTQHVYPRSTDPAYQSSVKIVSDGSKHTVTGAGYNPDKGTMEFTLTNHGFENGDKIRIDDNALVFTCAMDNNATEHSYPRKSDPISGKWVTITNKTNNTFEAHVGTTGAVTYDLTNAVYDPASGELTVSVGGNHDIDVGENIRFADNALTFTCGMDGNSSNHTYPRTTDPAYNTGLEVIGVGGNYDISNANYNPSTGVLEFTVANHGLTNGELIKIANNSLTFTCGMDSNASEHKYPRATDPYSGDWLSVYDVAQNSFKVQIADAGSNVEFTPTGAAYDPATGDLELTVGAHNLSVGDGIVMDDGAVSFTCTMDNNQVAQSYPRANLDKASGRSLPITSVDTGKFTINVGTAGTNKDFTPTGATYNQNNGEMVLTVGQHGLRVGTDITLKDNSLTFTCDKDGGATQHSYPRPGTDPYAGKSIAITAVGSSQHTATNVAYTPSTGVMVVTVPSHGFSPGDYIQVADNSITLTCELDGNVSQKTYPRTNFDSLSNRWVPILSASTDTLTINVGSSTDNSVHTFVSASANGILKQDGTLTINVGFDADPANRYAHTFVSALTDAVEYKPQSAHTFVSALTNSVKHLPQSAHTFKRATNYAISKRGGDITVNVGKSPIVEFTPTNATYDPNTGLMELTIGSHSLTAGTSVKVDPNSLKFTCEMDGNYSVKSYPRATDPVNDTSIEITAASATTITINVGQSPIVSHNVDDGSYNPATGEMTLKIGNHSLTVGESIKIDDAGVTFSCTYGNVPHTFITGAAGGVTADGSTALTAASGTTYDPITGELVLEVGAHALNAASTHTVTDATYNAATGTMLVTIANHGFSNGDRVKFAEGSISLNCAMDGNVSTKTYPRKSDPTFGKWLQISNVTTDSFSVDVGSSPLIQHTPTGANYNPTTGIMELTIGAHSLTVGTAVKIADNSLTFTCAEDNHQTTHTYPRTTDPFSDKSFAITDVTATTISVQVLSTIPSTNVTAHLFVSATADCVTSGGNYAHTFVSATASGLKKANSTITFDQDALTFTCDADNNATQHTYPRAGDPFRNETLGLDSVTGTTMTVFVGFSTGSQSAKSYPRSATETHTAAAGTTYDPTTGILSVTTAAHNIKNGDYVQFATGAFTFTCMEDNNSTNHTYPRVTDPVSSKWLKVSNVTGTTFDVQVLDVIPSTNVTAHTFITGSNNGITSKVDRSYDQAIEITGVTADTITVNVGPSSKTTDVHTFVSALAGAVKSGGGYVHTFKSADAGALKTGGNYLHQFVSATSGALISGGNYAHIFVSAVANGLTRYDGTVTFDVGTSSNTTAHQFVSAIPNAITTGGNYAHTFISSNPNGIKKANDRIRIDYGALNFTCDMDGHNSQHAYPRISDPAYQEDLPVLAASTNQFTVNIGTTGQGNLDVSDATYNPSTGDMTVTVGSHDLEPGQDVRIIGNSIKFSCNADNNATDHAYPRPTDPAGTSSLPVKSVGSSYHSSTDASYNPSTGDLVLTVANHGFTNGDRIKIADGSLTFTCDMDNHATEHAYPRLKDPSNGKWLVISDATTNTFKVNVGQAGASQTYTPTAATYTAATGQLVLTIPNHNIPVGKNITIAQDSLKFRCAMGGTSDIKTYPRSSDPIYSTGTIVTAADATTVTVNVGASPLVSHTPTDASFDPANGLMTLTIGSHNLTVGESVKIADAGVTFTCGQDNNATNHAYPRTTIESHTATMAAYDPDTGIITVTVAGHGMRDGDWVKLADDSLTFTCAQDSHATNHTYPRASDPISNKWVKISNTQTNTFDIQVLDSAPSTNTTDHTFVSAVAGGITQKKDKSYDSPVDITAVTATTITLDVGKSSNTTVHAFVSATADAITSGGNYGHTFVSADYGAVTADITENVFTPTGANYDPATGDLTLTIGSHSLAVGDGITIDDNSLTFKCQMDEEQSNKLYPRPASKGLTATTGTTYNPTTGIVSITTTANHGLKTGDFVKIADGALTFSCGFNGATGTAAEKSYPRPSDPVSGTWIKVTETGVDSFEFQCLEALPSTNTDTHAFISGVADGITRQTASDRVSGRSVDIIARTANTITVNVGNAGDNQTWTPSAADYNSTTGDLILTIGQHGLREGAGIILKDNSLTFTCSKDNHTSNHSYPRPGIDPYAGEKSITINSVGASMHSVSGAEYTPETGVLKLTVNNHGFSNGDYIKLDDESLTLTCDLDGNVNQKKYPRAGFDPVSSRWLKIAEKTTNTFEVNVGISQDKSVHSFVSAVANGLHRQNGTVTVNIGASQLTNYTPTAASYNAITGDMTLTIGVHDLQNGEKIKIAPDSLTFQCAKDANATNHTYPRVTDPAYNSDIEIKDATTTTITVNVGAAAANDQYDHTFVNATANAIIYNQRYTHTFVNSVANAVHFEPASPHTFVSATANSIRHYPTANHTFVRSVAGNVQKETGTFTVNVGVATLSNQYPHQFKSASAGAIQTGGSYFHKFVSAVNNSIHKVFTVAGNQQYHNQDCIDDVVDLLEAVADNIAYGGNDKTWDAAYSYKTGAHVAGEEDETNYVFEQAREMAAQALRNQKILVTGHHGLPQVFDKSITFNEVNPAPSNKFADARNLVVANKLLIADEAYERMLVQHPGFVPPTGNQQDCKDDIVDFVEEVSYNLAYGGNDRVWEMTDLYVQGMVQEVAGEEAQTTQALNHARDLMIQIARNENIVTLGSHGRTQVRDTTITGEVAPHVSSRHADAKNLILANVEFAAEVALGRMIAQFPSYSWQAGYSSTDCLDDLKDVVKVVAHNTGYGGNHRVWDAANLYVAGAHAAGSESETIFAFNAVRDIIKEIATNVEVTVGGHTSLTQTRDLTITNGVINGDCNVVLSAIDTLVAILTGTISDSTSLQGITRTDSVGPCEDMRSAVGVLTKIVTDAITDPSTLSGKKHTVTTSTYDPTTGWLTLDIGAHSYTNGTSVHIVDNSLTFTCERDNNATNHTYPRSTDPASNNDPTITGTTATTITVNVGISSDISTHTFVSASEKIVIGGVTRTPSVGSCEDVRSTLNSLFKIVIDTVETPTSLDGVTRTISNGACQQVASTITTLYQIITGTINSASYLDSVERNPVPLGLEFGPSINANATSTNSYLHFEFADAVYTTLTRTVDNTITQNTTYPQCVDQANAIRQYFANISTIIQTGLGSVPRSQPSQLTTSLSSRATVFTLTQGVGANPHDLETGTPIRLVPRPRYDTQTNSYVDVDKRFVRLPNGFATNQEYYVIAPARNTQPENYSANAVFNGSDQTKIMLASSKENAAAGIYLHSSEVEDIHPDIEIDIYQFVLDDNYDLHQYGCVLDGVSNTNIRTDVPHIFDVPFSNITGHTVFFREREGGSLPLVGAAYASDTTVADSQGRLLGNRYFFARYQTEKVFTIHKTKSDAEQGVNPITYQPGTYDFNVFANKRQSPMRFDPTFVNPNTNPVIYGKWYLQVENSNGTDQIIKRLREYADGIDKTNDSWFERIKDERPANDRLYRLRYVIPQYLQSVRDPLNGFTIKTRTDETRRIVPQKISLKPVSGGTTKARFSNPVQSNEYIGYTKQEFISNSLNDEIAYDPYKKDVVGNTQFKKVITTQNYISMTIQSGRYVQTGGLTDYLELTVFEHGVTNPALLNTKFNTIKITAPQGGSFTANKTQSVEGNKVEWAGNSSGYGYLHAIMNVPGTTTWHMILKDVVGKIDYDAIDNTRFSQGTAFADLLADADMGKSLVLKDLIKKEYPEFYYRQNGAGVYTITPGDIIEDDASIQYYVESVEDVGQIDDTFYVFNTQEIQKRIYGQQDGIYYLTAVRGNISPLPQGAGNLGNFRNFKFSQPISSLYPLNYKNDPLWYQQLDATLVDPPQTYSAADNYVHGLVRVNDFKGSLTQESVIDLVKNNAFGDNTYTQVSSSIDNRIKAQKGNAASGSEDRLIPISGDSTVVADQRYYVELRRPSIARAGNHTFEYLGFGPGNYSTGLPQRQEVVLTEIQDFYAQSKKQDGGLVFYTGLNSNGDLYIGNRKIDAITGEEVFLESATLVDSDDDDESLGNLVTTFDTPVTFNEYITVNGGEAQDKRSTFNSPVLINVLGTVRNNPALVISSFVDPAIDDGSLDRSAFVRNVETGGDVVIARNKISAAIFQFNSRRDGQGYKILTHITGATPSNITPDQTGAFNVSQIVSYGNAGAPDSGDMLLKGGSIGKSGSLGWIYSNYYTTIGNAVPESLAFNNTNVITLTWATLTNQQLGITSASELRFSGFSDPDFNGTWQVISNGFNPAANTLQFAIGATKNTVNNQNPRMWSDEVVANANITIEYSNSNWKEWGVIGAEAIRTETDAIGDYKLGINTVGRSDKASYSENFVDAKTNPRANLDVVGTAFISGKKITDYASHATDATRTYQDRTDAFMVGGDSSSPTDESTFRVSTANGGRVGVNVTDAELDRALVVDGESRFTGDARFEEDIEINGGGGANTAQIRTSITTGKVQFFPNAGGTPFTGEVEIAPLGTTIKIADATPSDQFIKIGNFSFHSNIDIGFTPTMSTNISKVQIGGAYENNESLSYTLIGTKSFKTKGDFQLGTVRGLLDTVKLTSTAGTVEFFAGNSATSKLDFATNASDITIAGKGGKTTVRNNLVVDSTARFNSDITLCGGFASYSFTAYRAQQGSTAFAHASGDLGNNIFNSNVDLIEVKRLVNTDENYNAIDTAGTGDWGGSVFQNPITQIAGTVEPLTLTGLSGDQYYLPLKNRPYDSNGVQYISEQDILLIDTDDSGGTKHPEFVKVISLPRINVAPYWIVVERLPFGTFTATRSDHSDTTAIYKCTVQYNATWTTTTIDDAGTEDNVYLAQFGGNIELGDYIIIDRKDTTNPANGIFDQGEVFKVKTLLSQVAKKLSIKNGCDTAQEETVFEVDSTTGDIVAGSGGTTIIKGTFNLQGSCSTPYTNSTTNKKLSITNGSAIKTFEVDTCTGDTTIGNHHGTVFMLAEQYGTSPAAYTKGVDEVHVYRHNPMSEISGGPLSTLAAAVVTATSNIEIQGNLTSFTKGDLVALYTAASIEIIQITDDPYTGTGGELILPTASNAEYSNGGRGMEGTSAQAFSIGTNLVKLDKYDRTTTLLHDVPALQADRATALKARDPNTSDIRLEISLADADLIAPKLDYVTLVRIGSEFFLPDSVDGTLDAFYAIKMPKQIREPNVIGTTPVKLFGGGSTTINQDLEVISGAVRMYGSDGKTLVMSIANDDGHSGDGSLEDPKTDTAGLTLKGAAAFYGDLKIYYDNCQMHGVCSTETSFRVTNREGNVLMGETFYQAGKVLSVESAIDPIFHIDNLGAAGAGGTEGPKDFKIYQNNAIDSFGIEKYWTAGGGRRHTYVAFDPGTGIGQQQDNALQVNQNYMINAASGANMVLYLPDNAQTGDMIRFIELSGNLTYNTSLILRAKKANNVSVAIQGDTTGSRIASGSGQTLSTAWDSGELIIQTRNASFGLVYAGTVDVEGSASAQTIPPALRGWWLIEL